MARGTKIFIGSTNDQTTVIRDNNTFKSQGLNLNFKREHILNQVAVIKGYNYQDSIMSVAKLGYEVKTFPSFTAELDDTKDISVIKRPIEYKNISWIDQVKNYNHNLGGNVVARILNHLTIWEHISSSGHPMIILEAPYQLKKALSFHPILNSIIDCTDLPMRKFNTNWQTMQGVHCYSVDQFSARRLFNYVLEHGIRYPLEQMFRDDLFMIMSATRARMGIEQ